MDLKALWTLCVLTLALCMLSQSSAQCSLDLGRPFGTIDGVPFQDLFTEYSSGSFIQNGLTYLCYTRSETEPETFSEIRVSVLYQYQSDEGTLQLTLDCRPGLRRWFYDNEQPSLLELPAANHVTENMTRGDCANCRDSSTASFGDPTYCSLPDPCIESSPMCANGGTCDRTGLTEVACQCAGGWTGMGCTECNVTCPRLEEALNEQLCSCETRGPTAPPLTPGAIVGIVIASFALLAIILAIIAVVVLVLVVDRKSRHNHV